MYRYNSVNFTESKQVIFVHVELIIILKKNAKAKQKYIRKLAYEMQMLIRQ